MSKFQIRWLALYILFGILISGCTPGLPPGAESTSIETITLTSTFTSAPTSTITPTPTPVPTATPAPVRLKKAIEDGVFGKIAEVGKGHILESVFSPEGSIFVAVLEHEIYIFNANTWEEVKYIPLNQDVWIYAIAFSKDGKALAFGDSNGMITIWNTETLEIEKSINSYESAVFSLDFSPDGKNLVSFGTNQIRLWNLSDGSLIGLQQQKFRGNIHYSEDGAWIISDLQGTNVWSAKDLRFIKTIKGSNYTQVVSPFSNIVARISEDLTILNLDTGKEIKIEKPFKKVNWEYDIFSALFIDNSHLVIQERDYALIHYVDINTGKVRDITTKELSELKSMNPNIWKITKANEIIELGFYPFEKIKNISRNGKYVMSEDGIFDTESWTIVSQKKEQESDWLKFFNLQNGDIARVDSSGGRMENYKFIISIFSGEDFTLKTTKTINYGLDKWYDIIQLSPNGKLLAVGVQYGSLYVYDVDKNEILAGTHNTQDYFKGFGAPITFSRIMFDENSTVLRTVGYDEVIKYWDAFTLEQIKDVTGTENSFVTTEKFNNIVWSDGLIFTRDLNKLKVWSGVDKTRITESPLPTGEALAVNLEGTRLYVSSSDGFISAWGYKP